MPTTKAPTLAGKVALITGGVRNIGRAISFDLAAAGVAVAVNARSSIGDGESVVREIRSAGGEAELYVADITEPAAVKAMVANVLQRFGRIGFSAAMTPVTSRGRRSISTADR